MPVVVTGAAGFIGRHLVTALARRGYDVVGIDRRPGVPACAGTCLVADLAETLPAEVGDALREAEAVFHLAGRPGVRGTGPEIERLRYRDNVLAAEQVLACVPPGTPLVVASSSAVYGGAWHQGRRPSRESDPLRPLGGYARSKVELERRCQLRAARGGLVAVARPFTVAGEGQRPDMAIARWLAAVRRGDPIRIFGSPDRRRDVTDVNDVVEGLIRMAEREASGPVNLGTGVGHRLGDLAAAVCQALGAPATTVIEPAGAEEAPATLADTTRCRTVLGFVPRTDLHALIRRQALAAGAPVPAMVTAV